MLYNKFIFLTKTNKYTLLPVFPIYKPENHN